MSTGVISALDSRPPVVCARHIEESARRDLDFVDTMDQRVRESPELMGKQQDHLVNVA